MHAHDKRRLAGALCAAAVTLTTSAAASANEVSVCVDAVERAQVQRDLGKYASARQSLLVCGRPSCPAVVRRDCIRWLAEVERSTPSIVVTARDPQGRDVVGPVRVLVDGQLFVERLDGRPREIDPGEHVFRYELPSGAAREERVIISAGERERILRVHLGARAEAAPVRVAADRGAPPAPEPAARVEVWSDRRTVGLVVAGAGLVAVGVGAVFGARALSKSSDAEALCSQAACASPEADSLSSDALTSANVANVSIGAGLLALGVGAYLVLTSSRTVRAAPRAAAMRILPVVGRDGGGASLGASW